MKRSAGLAAGLVLAACITSAAMAAEVTESIEIKASPDKVWGVMGDFGGIVNWLPPVASSPATNGNMVGSIRTLTLKAPGDPTVVEKLQVYDAGARRYTYTIERVDPKVLPVVHYRSTIAVSGSGGDLTVQWHGEFDPAAGVDEATAVKAMTDAYRAGLGGIKAAAEK